MIASHAEPAADSAERANICTGKKPCRQCISASGTLAHASARLALPLCSRGWCLSLRRRLHRIRRLWLGRELQHGRLLTCAEMREQHDLAVGKLQRIMMRAGIVHVYLTESRHSMR